jgi:putative oxidoreductase
MERGATVRAALAYLGAIGLGALFVYAGVSKLADPAGFADDIGLYGLTPRGFSAAGALYLPWLEIVCGSALALRWRPRGALVILGLMTTVFTLFVVSAWARGLDVSCGCFGRGEGSTDFALATLRNGAILGGIVLLYVREVSRERLRPGTVPAEARETPKVPEAL